MVNVYDVGDAAPLLLTVDKADPTTVAVVDVLSPSGVEVRLAAVPNAKRDEWTTALRLTEPGVWLTTWTVTGLGAGVERHRVVARASRAGRSYASTGDLARHPAVDVVPLDADRLLARATLLVDRVMVGARWTPAEGSDNLPADEHVAAAYRDAVCAVAAGWLEAGAGDYGPTDDTSGDDDGGDEALDDLVAFARTTGATSVAWGGVTIGLKGSGDGSSSGGVDWTDVRPAVDVLSAAGLFPPRIGVVW